MDKNADRIILQDIARKAMISRGLEPDFPEVEIKELNKIILPAACKPETARDMRDLLWCSVDNADSRDLDQLTYAETLEGNKVKIMVAIADVDALVSAKSNIDIHAGYPIHRTFIGCSFINNIVHFIEHYENLPVAEEFSVFQTKWTEQLCRQGIITA